MYRKKSRVERTKPWGDPVLMVWDSETCFPIFMRGFRKSVIHLQVESSMWIWESVACSRAGRIVLKAELKSTNRNLAYVPGESTCWRVWCRAMFTASPTDLLAL